MPKKPSKVPEQPHEFDSSTQHARNEGEREKPSDTPPRRKGQRMTAKERAVVQEQFLKVLADTANVRVAAEAVGVDRTLIYYWAEKNKKFKERFDAANDWANWLLFREAWHRALIGDEVYVTSMGRIVYEEVPVLDEHGEPLLDEEGNVKTVRTKPLKQPVKSDRLLEFMMKNRIPEFRDKQDLQVSGLAEMIDGAQQSLLRDLATLPEVKPDAEQAADSSASADPI